MNSGKLVILVIPSIIALVFSVFVTIGIIGDIPTRADRAKNLQHKDSVGPVIVLTPPAPLKSQIPHK
jgi:hypothetical protein